MPVPTPEPLEPIGDIVIRTIAMPADANANGDIFGGWVLSQMDLGAGVAARRLAKCRVTTVAIDAMSFVAPVNVGDVVTCYAKMLHVGRTSMRIGIEAWAQRFVEGTFGRVTYGTFTYVAIDQNGRPQPAVRPDEPPV